MPEERYLYGASVQGIQSFIFQTNELKDIVGASELVDKICREAFIPYCGNEEDSVLRAAGNIKHVFTDKAQCEKAVREFPKAVMTMAPGITISQAVVKLEGDYADFDKAIEELERRLFIQRNQLSQSTTIGLTGILRSRNTGFSAIKREGGDYLDSSTVAKRTNTKVTSKLCEKSFGAEKINMSQIALDIDDMTGKNSWIAIIHIDGNGLGKEVKKHGKTPQGLKYFSENLDKGTIQAANEAFKTVRDKFDRKMIPIRPIVLGGDDVTLICRADIAIDYTTGFLKEFEKQTNLKACAGIAFIKSSYPFYYGYDLAQSLCDRAKKKTREADSETLPSCLMFHKVQDSFVEDFEAIKARELTTKTNVSFEYGPYFLHSQSGYWTIEELMKIVTKFDSDKGGKVKSHLRQWMSLLFTNEEMAKQKMERVKSLLSENQMKEYELEKLTNLTGSSSATCRKVPVYDILSIYSILYHETKKWQQL